jgi:RHS repeat-associated protein
MIILFLFASHARADQDTAPDFTCDPGVESGSNFAFGGKPVSLVSGAETFSRTDLSLGSLYPITIQRRYNSRSGYDSPLGYGWALNFDKRIYTYPDGSVTLRKECGWKIRFTWSAAGYLPSTGETGTLVQNVDGSFLYTDKSGEKETYDPQGRLTSMADAKGNSLLLAYTGATRENLWGLLLANIDQTSPLIVAYDYHLSKIEEKDAAGALTGNWVALHYSAATGRLMDIQDNIGRIVSYTQDNIGNLTAASSPSGSAAYGYSGSTNKHLLTSIDEGQGAYENTYDSTGKVTRQTHGAGVIEFEYTTPYQKTKLTNTIKNSAGTVQNTQTRTVEFDSNGQPNKVTDTDGNVRNYTRDTNMLLTREEYWENTGSIDTPNLVLKSATDYTYDSKGNALTRTDFLGNVTTWTYHPTFSKVLTETVKSVVDPLQNKVITNTYDAANGNLLTTTETGLLGNVSTYSYTTTYTYDSNGRVKTIDGPRTDVSDVTTYYYDSVTGYLTSVTQPLIGTTTYSGHDSLGNPQTVTDPNGNATTYTYDTTGRVLTVKAPGDTSATQYVYVSAGCSTCGGGANKIDHITLPEGNTIWYTYDTMGNLSAIKDSLNNTINYTYDSEGNRLTEQINDSAGALQKTLSYQYDALNRLAKTVNPDSTYTQYGYDSRGNRTSLRTPNSALTTYSYDALNRLITVIQPGNITTSYEYNSSNNLTKVTDANSITTTYKYDDKGRVYQVISPDTGTTTYGYDPAGNLTSKADAKGVTISYVYDALNRLTKIDFPGTSETDIEYSYDKYVDNSACLNGKGRLCTMTDASGTTSYEYTPKGQVKKETKVIDAITYVTQYTYDMNGNLRTMTYPSGRVVTYNYTNDRAVSVLNNAANLATNINYKPFGGISSLNYGNGLTSTIGYDNQYRVASITAGTVMNLSYADDSNGNITGITDSLDATKNKSFGYDALDRLTSGTGSWGTLGWTYDGVGNRQTENTNSYTYTAGTNKLSSANGKSYGYDNNGNTTTENARIYTYNQNQRLIQVVDGAMTAGYTHNGNGQRVKKTVNGQTTVFHYSLSGQLIAESDGTGATTSEYVYLNSQPLAKIEGSNIYYYHNDHLATPQKMTDSSGTIVWAADYKPFGEATVSTNTIANNLRFPGQYFDAETGLNYNYYRDYNPTIGRYVQADPIGLQAGPNVFIYAVDNPNRFVDLTGLKSCCPKDEKSTIEARITAVNNQINNINSTGQAKPGIVYGTTYCMPWGPGTPQINQSLSPCIKNCVKAHENVHVQQCKNSWIDYTFKMTEAELEKPAYQAELTCLKSYSNQYEVPCKCEK